MENSEIQWTNNTFNPWMGCTKISPGCTNCYAEKLMDSRYGKVQWGAGNPRVLTSDANWKKPLQWNKKAIASGIRQRVFCASLADVFDPEVPQEWRDRLWMLIEKCSALDWQLLTKRLNVLTIEELLSMVPEYWRRDGFPSHVWIGHSICTQREADKVIPEFSTIPSSVRFLSCEPLLEVVRLDGIELINWVIIGGESGAKARPFNIEWARSLIRQCKAEKVPVFMKQLGHKSFSPHNPMWDNAISGKGADPDEWPEDLRVREMPNVEAIA